MGRSDPNGNGALLSNVSGNVTSAGFGADLAAEKAVGEQVHPCIQPWHSNMSGKDIASSRLSKSQL